MTKENKQESKTDTSEEVKEEEQTSSQESSTDENGLDTQGHNDSSQEGDTSAKNEKENEEQVTLSKEEFELLQKKSTDYDGMIEKKRLEKLRKKEEEVATTNTSLDENKVLKMVDEKVGEVLREQNKTLFESNLKEAYSTFIIENKWADDDEKVSKIAEKFMAGTAINKDDLLVKLGEAARQSFPVEYAKSQEEKIRAKILAEDSSISVGNSGGGTTVKKGGSDGVKGITAEQKRIAELCGHKPEEVYKD